MLLAEQDTKMKAYRTRLKELGEKVGLGLLHHISVTCDVSDCETSLDVVCTLEQILCVWVT